MNYIFELREEIKNKKNKNRIFQGMITKTSFRVENDKMVPTIMMKDIIDSANERFMTDHIWFDTYPHFGKFKRYDIIRFEAEPIKYKRSNNTEDYGLKVTKIIKRIKS